MIDRSSKEGGNHQEQLIVLAIGCTPSICREAALEGGPKSRNPRRNGVSREGRLNAPYDSYCGCSRKQGRGRRAR